MGKRTKKAAQAQTQDGGHGGMAAVMNVIQGMEPTQRAKLLGTLFELSGHAINAMQARRVLVDAQKADYATMEAGQLSEDDCAAMFVALDNALDRQLDALQEHAEAILALPDVQPILQAGAWRAPKIPTLEERLNDLRAIQKSAKCVTVDPRKVGRA